MLTHGHTTTSASPSAPAATGASHVLRGHGEPWRGSAEEAVEVARRNGTR